MLKHPMHSRTLVLALCLSILLVPLLRSPSAAEFRRVPFRINDCVAFLGGADVSAAQRLGHLEALVSASHPSHNLRFRNFAWEGDTVWEQPRDFNFPPIAQLLERSGVDLLFVQFGRAEALQGSPSAFLDQLERRLQSDLRPWLSRLVLVTPPPFERAPAPLPDLSPSNSQLAEIAEGLRQLASKHNLGLVDLFGALHPPSPDLPTLTDDGLQLTPRGHALVAAAFARALGLNPPVLAVAADGTWDSPPYEALRQAVIEKNRLWFNYWRPQNWAFLGGDRTTQPSSRDYRNPEHRWFPEEMKRYESLIAAEEEKIRTLLELLP